MPNQNAFISIDDIQYPLLDGQPPRRRNEQQFPQKTLIGGDPRPSDHNVWSALSLSRYRSIGRHVYRQVEEGVDRLWDSALDTRWSDIVMLPPEMKADVFTDGGSHNQIPGGFLFPYPLSSGGYSALFWANGTNRYIITSFAYAGGEYAGCLWVLDDSPYIFANPPAYFKGLWYAPLSGSNYRYGSSLGLGLPLLSAGPKEFIAFVPTYNLLYGLVYEVGAQAWERKISVWACAAPDSGVATWTNLTGTMLLNSTMFTVGGFALGYTSDGQQALYISTSFGLIQVDPATGIYSLVLEISAEENIPTPLILWSKTNAVYVSDGGQNLWEVGASVRNITPFLDDGLPQEGHSTSDPQLPTTKVPIGLTGRIISLFQTQNWLGAVIQQGGNNVCSSIWLYDGIGWHSLARSSIADVVTPRSRVWGNCLYWNGYLHVIEFNDSLGNFKNSTLTIPLPDTKMPPWVQFASSKNHAESGAFVTPWFDNDMIGIPKLAERVEVFADNLTSTEIIGIEYQADVDWNNGTWVSLGNTSASSGSRRVSLDFANPGLVFYRIRFRVTLARQAGVANRFKTPLLRNFAFRFLVRPRILETWNVSIDCREGFNGKTPAELETAIWTALKKTEKVKVRFPAWSADRYLAISAMSGNETIDPLYNPAGVYNFTLIEVRPDA